MSTFIGIPRIPSRERAEVSEHQSRVVWMALSLLLDYPTEATTDVVALVREEARDLPAGVAKELLAFCDAIEASELREMQKLYVETFDQRRRCALGLTYYSHGDTRGRGQAILTLKEIMRRSGFESARSELADHLPLVLEFCALDDSGSARHVLGANREGIEVLRTALRSSDSPYRHLLNALVLTLPQMSEKELAAYKQLISQGPPTELVGIGGLEATPFPTANER